MVGGKVPGITQALADVPLCPYQECKTQRNNHPWLGTPASRPAGLFLLMVTKQQGSLELASQGQMLGLPCPQLACPGEDLGGLL